MPRIDPTARVSVRAKIADDVRIGPWCIVGKDVQLAEGAHLRSMVVIEGKTTVGPRCQFHHGAVIGTAPQDLKYRGAPSSVRIGAESVFREYCTVNRATSRPSARTIAPMSRTRSGHRHCSRRACPCLS